MKTFGYDLQEWDFENFREKKIKFPKFQKNKRSFEKIIQEKFDKFRLQFVEVVFPMLYIMTELQVH